MRSQQKPYKSILQVVIHISPFGFRSFSFSDPRAASRFKRFIFIFQVVCGECISTTHRNHLYEPISRVAKSHLTNLKQAADRAKTVVEESAVASSKLMLASKKIEAHCNKVHSEVEKFIEDYIKAVEDHKMNLLEQIKQVY